MLLPIVDELACILCVIEKSSAFAEPKKTHRSPRRLRLLVMTIKGMAPRDDASLVIARNKVTQQSPKRRPKLKRIARDDSEGFSQANSSAIGITKHKYSARLSFFFHLFLE